MNRFAYFSDICYYIRTRTIRPPFGRHPLIAKFMRPTWGPSGADRTQVGPMLAPITFLSGSSWLKIVIFWLKSKWSLCLKIQYENRLLLIYGKCLAANRWRAIIWTNDGLIYWHIYASLILNVLRSSWIGSHKNTGNWQNKWHTDKNEIDYTTGNQILKSHQWI